MHTQSLNDNWQFREAGTDEGLPAQVPGSVHTDLLALERIPDPFVGDNERRVQWVAERDWEYRCTFEVALRLLDEERVFLGENDVSVVDLDRCIGCGLCVVSCPTEAARLAPNPVGGQPARCAWPYTRYQSGGGYGYPVAARRW